MCYDNTHYVFRTRTPNWRVDIEVCCKLTRLACCKFTRLACCELTRLACCKLTRLACCSSDTLCVLPISEGVFCTTDVLM